MSPNSKEAALVFNEPCPLARRFLTNKALEEEEERRNTKLTQVNKKERIFRFPISGGAAVKSVSNKLRDAAFPVYGRDEILKFTLLGAMKFFIIVVLTLTRDTKDTLVVTECGAESIAFLKIWGVLPSALAFTAWYSKISSLLNQNVLFYVTAVPFFVFFLLYNSVLYPNRDLIEPSLDVVQSFLGLEANANNGVWFVASNILSHWTSALYFIIAELYSSVSIGILFWKTANDVVHPQEAKRFYPLFAYTSGFAPIFAGQYAARFASKASDFQASMGRLTLAITVSGFMIGLINHMITITQPMLKTTENKQKNKPKLTAKESFQYLSRSEYLRHMATLVLGYGLMYNFTEISWKSLLKKRFPNALEYQQFMGNFSSMVGASTFFVIFLASNIIKNIGWRIGAMATPLVMATVALPFFFSLIFMDFSNPIILDVTVKIGTALILLSRCFKYGMFDATTQMAYVPLDEESKVKGKAAIDVLGSRLGKSGASFVQQGLVAIFGNILSAAPAIAVFYYAVSFNWLRSAFRLGTLYNEMVGDVLAADDNDNNNKKTNKKD